MFILKMRNVREDGTEQWWTISGIQNYVVRKTDTDDRSIKDREYEIWCYHSNKEQSDTIPVLEIHTFGESDSLQGIGGKYFLVETEAYVFNEQGEIIEKLTPCCLSSWKWGGA